MQTEPVSGVWDTALALMSVDTLVKDSNGAELQV